MLPEIPDAEQLGLRPDKLYSLYRDPDELRKAASTFNGKPLLLAHRPQSADDHSRELTVGSVKNCRFDPPYLMAELDIWDAEAIYGITSGDQRELSCGYRYVADMRPGQIGGVRYDGVMRQIQGNHVALVTTGRAGSDVVVGDSVSKSFMKRDSKMSASNTTAETWDATVVFGNLIDYLKDLLTEEQPDEVNSLLDGNQPTVGREEGGEEGAHDRLRAKRGVHGARGLTGDAAVQAQRAAMARDGRYQRIVQALDATDSRRLAMFPNANRLR